MEDDPGTCPSCGLAVLPEDGFCEACGHALTDAGIAVVVAAGACIGCGAVTIDADGYCEQCGIRQPSGRDHVERELAGVSGVSDKGLRHSKNEDAMAFAVLCLPAERQAIAAVVCDGVSTSPHPEDASQAAADAGLRVLQKELESGADPEPASREALTQAAAAVAALAGSAHDAPACTYVSALVLDGAVTLAWVGDSRAYWLPGQGTGIRLTQDDSWAGQMVTLGALTEAEAQAHRNAHMLVGWLGADADAVDPHVATFTPDAPGLVVVCSDGLWNYLPEPSSITAALPPTDDPLHLARSLVQTALDAGGHDNITVVVIPFTPEDTPA
jgi:serine/threonine protein phosphatase PrpC